MSLVTMGIQIQQAKLIRMAALSSVVVAISLVFIKGFAWWLSGSVSLLAGLTDSLLDSFSSFLNLVAITIALRPADSDHRYGHGKAEALAGLGQALFITASALVVGWQSIIKLWHPEPLAHASVGVVVMLISLGVTIGLVGFQQYVVKKTGSTAIAADSLHYRTDILLNISILLALIFAYLGWKQSDALFGLAISFYILWSAFTIGKEATSVLMDEELPKEITDAMLVVAKEVPEVIGIHDMRSRKSGVRWFIEMHVELPAAMSLEKAHYQCLVVRKTIQQRWPQTDVIIHADPR